MELTAENKAKIDAMTYEELLRRWRFAPAGDPWFAGATGDYWAARMNHLKEDDPEGAVAASKRLGWGR